MTKNWVLVLCSAFFTRLSRIWNYIWSISFPMLLRLLYQYLSVYFYREFSQQVSRDYVPQQHQLWSTNHTSGPPMMPDMYPPHGFVTGPHPHFASPPATPMTPMTPATLQPPFSNIHQFHDVPPANLYHQT